jgi:hypothetical protein
MIIDKVRVDRIDYERRDGAASMAGPSLTAHFNCFDAEGNSLPGLGGYLHEKALARAGRGETAWGQVRQEIEAMAQELVRRYDEYYAGVAEITRVELLRYPTGGQGVNVRHIRPGDWCEAALLFVHGAEREMSMNYKRTVGDEAQVAYIDAEIERLFGVVEAAAAEMNRQRGIKRREQS